MTLAACSGGTDAAVELSTTATSGMAGTTTTPPPETTARPGETTTTARPLVGVSADFARTVIELDGVAHPVAVADTTEQRAQGLMGVEELDPLFGMLFIFDNAAVRSFWMKDTLIPLDIAFFDSNGVLVTKTSMEPCPGDECPRYSSVRAARYALEAPLGDLDGLAEGSRLVLIEAIAGSGKEI